MNFLSADFFVHELHELTRIGNFHELACCAGGGLLAASFWLLKALALALALAGLSLIM